jgi:hypothetical protein
MLNRRASELTANVSQQGVAVFALDALKFDLDQLMGFQGAVDFLYHGVGKAFAGNGNDRMKQMGGGAQGAALFGSQFDHIAILAR